MDELVERIDKLIPELRLELTQAIAKHGAFPSLPHGMNVLFEEVDELWDVVKLRHPDPVNIKEEALQVAAMAMEIAAMYGIGGTHVH